MFLLPNLLTEAFFFLLGFLLLSSKGPVDRYFSTRVYPTLTPRGRNRMSIPEGVLVWQSNETSPAPKHPRMSYHVRFPVSHTSSPHITDTYPTLLCTHSRTGPQGASPGSAVTASPGKPSCFALAQGGPTGCLSGICSSSPGRGASPGSAAASPEGGV